MAAEEEAAEGYGQTASQGASRLCPASQPLRHPVEEGRGSRRQHDALGTKGGESASKGGKTTATTTVVIEDMLASLRADLRCERSRGGARIIIRRHRRSRGRWLAQACGTWRSTVQRPHERGSE